MQLGNGKWESTQFNSRLQPTQIALGTVQNCTDKLKLDYSYNTPNVADNNGNVKSQTITLQRLEQIKVSRQLRTILTTVWIVWSLLPKRLAAVKLGNRRFCMTVTATETLTRITPRHWAVVRLINAIRRLMFQTIVSHRERLHLRFSGQCYYQRRTSHWTWGRNSDFVITLSFELKRAWWRFPPTAIRSFDSFL